MKSDDKVRPRVRLIQDALRSGVRNETALRGALSAYRVGTAPCKLIDRFLIDRLHPSTFGGKKSRKYWHLYVHTNEEHFAVAPQSDKLGLLRFMCYPCNEDGSLRLPRKQSIAPLRLCAPDFWALVNGCKVPLSGLERSKWKVDLEGKVFARKGQTFPDAPLPELDDPTFLYEPDGPAFQDEHGFIQARKLWFWWLRLSGRQRQPRRKQLELVYRLWCFFWKRWRTSTATSRDGLPRFVEASDDYLARYLGVSVSTARTARLLLERGNYIQKAVLFRSKVGSRHYGYLPGSGNPMVAMPGLENAGPWLFADAMRCYREAFGLYYDGELALEEAEENKAAMAHEAYWDAYVERHNANSRLIQRQ